MAVDFADLRYKLQTLDIWSVQDRKQESVDLVESLDTESLRALALMAAKRHTVLKPAEGTKTFELLENVIVGLHSEDCAGLARQVVAIAPDWMLTTFLLASINRFNTVDQLELRKTVLSRGDGELSLEELAQAEAIAEEAAARQAAIERGEIAPEAEAAPPKGRAAKKAPRGRAAKAAKEPRAKREKKQKLDPQERARLNRQKNAAANTQAKLNPDKKVKTSWLTGKPKN